MNWLADAGLVLLGFGVGTLGTLIGAGGGFILVPVLLLLYPDIKPDAVTTISLAVVFFNAASGSSAYMRMKRVDYKSAFIFAAATLPGSIIGALITSYVSRTLFNTILGVLLMAVSVFLVFRSKKITGNKKANSGAGGTYRKLTDADGHVYEYRFKAWIGVVISFFVGFLSSFLGIGGGIIHVPALVGILDFPVYIATATSHFILAIMALAGTIVHIIQGTFQQTWQMTLFIAAGVIFGAQLGARLSHSIKSDWIILFLAIALFLVGIRLIMPHK